MDERLRERIESERAAGIAAVQRLQAKNERLRDGIREVQCQMEQNNISKAAAADWLREILTAND